MSSATLSVTYLLVRRRAVRAPRPAARRAAQQPVIPGLLARLDAVVVGLRLSLLQQQAEGGRLVLAEHEDLVGARGRQRHRFGYERRKKEEKRRERSLELTTKYS